MMRQSDPGNVNLPYMLLSLAGWIASSEQKEHEGRVAEAEKLILEAKTLLTRHYGEDHVATLSADSSLANLARTRGDLVNVERIREELVGRYLQVEDGRYYHIWALLYLAESKLALGKVAEAEKLFEQAQELGRSQWGANDFRFERLVRAIRQARAAARK